MADSTEAFTDYFGGSENEEDVEKCNHARPELGKQESLVLYTQAALSGGKMSTRKGRMGRRPRSILLKQTSEQEGGPGPGVRRAFVKQQSETDAGVDNTGRKYLVTHQETPNIVISGDCDASDEDDDYEPRTPLPVLPIILPEPDSDEETQETISQQLPDFLGITQRYRRSSLVRMDAVKQPTGNLLETGSDEPVRKLSVHGSLDLPKNTLRDLIKLRKAQSFNAEDSEEDDTVTISEIHPSGKSNMLTVPEVTHGKFKRKGSKKKKPSLRRLLTITTEPQLDREELEERRTCRKKEKEERRKERMERKLREKQKREEERYDEDGVSIKLCDNYKIENIYLLLMEGRIATMSL